MNRILLIVFVVALAALPLVPATPEFWVTQLNYIGLASLVVLGLVLLTGVGGLTSFGQAASSAWAPHHGLPDHPVRRVAVAGPAGRPGADRRGRSTWWARSRCACPATTAAGHHRLGAVAVLPVRQHRLAGKHDGIAGIEPISIFGISLASGRHIYFLICLRAAGAAGHAQPAELASWRHPRAQERAGMAESMGVNTAAYKVVIRLPRCWPASGWLYAHMQRAVSPSPFGINYGIEYLFMAVVGGAGYVWARCWARPSSWC